MPSTEIIDLKPLWPATTAPQDEDGPGLPRVARIGWIVIALFFGVFLGFAAFVRMDAAAYADGTVKVSGSRRPVQHRDGGVVRAMHVREGQHVRAGEILIELAGAEAAASERALASQVIGLQAQRARLLAEQGGAPTFAAPPEFAALTGDDRQLAADAMKLQTQELGARRQAVASQKDVLKQQAAQLNQKIAGLGQQIDATRRQNDLFGDQLKGMRELAAKGYASVNRLRELERAQAQLSGDTANLTASSASAREQIGETRMQALSIDTQRQQEIARELETNMTSLNDALPKWQDARQRLEATRIRAPASGQVVGLAVFSPGSVITPSEKVMEIVPDQAALVIEPMISPADAAELSVGQAAEVRFPSLHRRDLPIFEGRITRLSADSFVDDKTGARFYTGEVTVAPEVLAKVAQASDGLTRIKPGLPATILVPLQKRTLLQYLLEPVTQSLWRGGHEH